MAAPPQWWTKRRRSCRLGDCGGPDRRRSRDLMRRLVSVNSGDLIAAYAWPKVQGDHGRQERRPVADARLARSHARDRQHRMWRMTGLVESEIRRALGEGATLTTPSRGARFSVARLDSAGIALLLGKREACGQPSGGHQRLSLWVAAQNPQRRRPGEQTCQTGLLERRWRRAICVPLDRHLGDAPGSREPRVLGHAFWDSWSRPTCDPEPTVRCYTVCRSAMELAINRPPG